MAATAEVAAPAAAADPGAGMAGSRVCYWLCFWVPGRVLSGAQNKLSAIVFVTFFSVFVCVCVWQPLHVAQNGFALN